MKKILSSNSLKIIAVLAMLLDHIAFLFIPVSSLFYFVFRIIGRVTAPIMFMGIANGYHHTSNKFRYGIRLLFFALISHIPYSLFIDNKVFLYDSYNVLFTLFLGLLCLCSLYNIKNMFLKIFLIIMCVLLSYFSEYGLFGISLILMFSLFKTSRWKTYVYSLICLLNLIFVVITTKSMVAFIIYLGLFLVIPLIKLYNGKKGKYNLKYAFYLFYPLHLLVLVLINLLLG